MKHIIKLLENIDGDDTILAQLKAGAMAIMESDIDEETATTLGDIPENSSTDEISDIEGAVDDAIQIEKDGAVAREEYTNKIDNAVKDIQLNVDKAVRQ